MLKIIIKDISTQETKVLELNNNVDFKLKENEQFFIDNSEGSIYKIELINNEKSLKILFQTNPNIEIILKDVVELVSNNKSILGIIDTKEGLEELNKTVLNDNFEGDNVISSLKEMLSKSSLSEDIKDGIIIDDFGSLTNAMEATAAGNEIIENISTYRNIQLSEENSNNILDGRSRLEDSELIQKETIFDRDRMEELVIEEPLIKAVLSATDSTSEDGGSITYTVNLVDENGDPVSAKEDIVITLENGETITIKAGESSGSVVTDVNKDDVYKESDSISNAIKGVTGGDSFEKLEADNTAVETIITDDVDVVTLKISGDTSVVEGENATYTVSLTDENGNPVIAKEDMEVTFTYTYVSATGEDITETKTVTIKAGESEASFEVETKDDVYSENDESFKISIDSVTNTDAFEKIIIDDISVETIITDDEDNVNINLVGNGTEREYEQEFLGKGSYINMEALADGSYVMTWQIKNSDGKWNTVVQKFDSDGNKVGDTITFDEGENRYGNMAIPKITTFEDGSYIVVFWGENSEGGYSLFIQKFNSDGTKSGDIIESNTPGDYGDAGIITSSQDIVTFPDGSYIIVWKSENVNEPGRNSDIFIKKFNADGTPNGDTVIINNTKFERDPKIVSSEDGSYIVTWIHSEGGTSFIMVQQFNADGTAGDLVQLGGKSNDSDRNYEVEFLSDGSYIISWYGKNSLYIQNFNADGTLKGNMIELEASNNKSKKAPEVIELADGSYVIGWAYVNANGQAVYEIQKFDSDGTSIGNSIEIEVPNTFHSGKMEITALLDGSFVVVYQDNGHLYVQQFNADGTPANDVIELPFWGKGPFSIITLADGSYIISTSGDFSGGNMKTQRFNPDGSRIIENGDSISEGESATYEVTLTDDNGNPVIAKEDMVVTFKYTFTTIDGKNIVKVGTVIIKAGESSANIDIKTLDDVYKEGAEKFYIEIVDVTNVDQFEKVTVDDMPIETIINDETPPDNVNIKISGDTSVVEGENATYTVSLTDENGDPVIAKKDMEVTFTYTYKGADGKDITETKTVTIKAGESEASFEVETKDDVYSENDESFSISINDVTNVDQFEKVTVDDTPVETVIKDETPPDNVNIKLETIDGTVVEGESGKYKVTLTDDDGNPVIAKEDMEVTFTYTYKTADGKDVNETKTVTIKAGESEVSFDVETTHNKYEVTPDSTGDTVLINTNGPGETGANYGSGNTYGFQTPPVVVSLGNGNVMYVWGDSAQADGYDSKLFAKIYDANGHVVTDTFRVGDYTFDTSSGWDPINYIDVKVLENGNVIIGYTSWHGTPGIGQRPITSIIDPTKQPGDDGFYIIKDKPVQQQNDYGGSPYESGPTFTVLADGRILAIFVTGANTASQKVYGRIMNEDGTFSTDEFRIGNKYLEETLYNVNAAENLYVQELSNGNIVIGMKGSDNQPYFTIVDSDGNTIVADVPAHSSNLAGNETAPIIIELADGKFMAMWVNGASGGASNGNMYGRIFNADGTPALNPDGTDSHFKLGDGSFYWNNSMDIPMLKYDYLTNGNVVIGWAKAGSPVKTMVTILDKNGNEVANIEVEDDTHSKSVNSSYPIVKALGDGNFVVVWSDFSNIANQHLYYRIFDSEGNPISDQILLSSSSTLDYLDQYVWDSVSVDVIDDNSFVVGWVGDRFDSTDGSQTSVISVQVDLGKEGDENLTISIDGVTNTDQFEKVTIDDSENDLNIIDKDSPNCSHNEVSRMLSEDIDLQALSIQKNEEEVVVDLENKMDDYLILDDKTIEDLTNSEEIIKIFGDDSQEDRVKLEGDWEKSNTQETIDGEKFNVYSKGTSNIKILIDEDIKVDSEI